MADLSSLRPTDGSPGAIAAALTRVGVAGRAALAEIERLKSERAILLARGQATELSRNLGELTEAMSQATQIGELLDQLQQAPKANAPDPAAEIRAATIESAAALTGWWQQHGPVVLDGVRVLFNAAATIITAAKAATPPAPSNVAPFPPRPAA